MYSSQAVARTCWKQPLLKSARRRGDVANLNDLDRLYESVKRYGRRLDVIFANAGIALQAPFGNVDEKFFDLHFDANVKGLFFSVQKGLPFLNDGGSIILNASIATTKGFPGISVYSATKAAVRSFARTWTNELRDRRIRVNAISPGHIDTPIFEGWQQSDALIKMKNERRACKKRSARTDGRFGRHCQSRRVSRFRRSELCLGRRTLRRWRRRPNLNNTNGHRSWRS